MSPLLRTRPVRFTAETFAAVDEQSHAAGLTPSAFIRAAVDEKLGRPTSSAPAVGDLAAEVAELRRLRHEWQQQMSAVEARLALPMPPSTTTPPPADESGLDELTL